MINNKLRKLINENLKTVKHFSKWPKMYERKGFRALSKFVKHFARYLDLI